MKEIKENIQTGIKECCDKNFYSEMCKTCMFRKSCESLSGVKEQKSNKNFKESIECYCSECGAKLIEWSELLWKPGFKLAIKSEIFTNRENVDNKIFCEACWKSKGKKVKDLFYYRSINHSIEKINETILEE